MNFVSNIIWNSVEGFVEAGKRTAGGYAGDALIKAGDMIENSGRSVGNGIEKKATGYGGKISGQTYAPSAKALPSTARKPAIKRSNSSPASSKAATNTAKPTSKPPTGGSKYLGASPYAVTPSYKPVGRGVSGAKSTATKSVAGIGSTATKGIGGIGSTATKGIGRSSSPASKSTTSLGGAGTKAVGGATGAVRGGAKALPKPFPNNVPYGAKSGLDAGKGVASSKADNLPKPFGAPAYPTEKKTAVKPGQRKDFKVDEKKDEPKPYPGTNTLPGQGSRTPVRAQKYKPIERMKPPAEKGSVTHITV